MAAAEEEAAALTAAVTSHSIHGRRSMLRRGMANDTNSPRVACSPCQGLPAPVSSQVTPGRHASCGNRFTEIRSSITPESARGAWLTHSRSTARCVGFFGSFSKRMSASFSSFFGSLPQNPVQVRATNPSRPSNDRESIAASIVAAVQPAYSGKQAPSAGPLRRMVRIALGAATGTLGETADASPVAVKERTAMCGVFPASPVSTASWVGPPSVAYSPCCTGSVAHSWSPISARSLQRISQRAGRPAGVLQRTLSPPGSAVTGRRSSTRAGPLTFSPLKTTGIPSSALMTSGRPSPSMSATSKYR